MRKVLDFLAVVSGSLIYIISKLLGFPDPELPEDTDTQGYDDDGLLRIPVRLVPEVVEVMVNDWYPIGFGAAHLVPQSDGSFDFVYKEADLSNHYNLVKLDKVNESLMAALDLATLIQDNEYEVPEEISTAARNVERVVRSVGR